jgi:DUF4097 and DUF4098 domain-containing protein YvlB
MKFIFTIILATFICCTVYPQQHKETIKKEIDFPEGKNAVLVIENISGKIEIEGYSGDKVSIEIYNEFFADSKEELEEAMKKVYLSFETRKDTVDIFLDGVCGCNRDRHRNNNWERCDFDYRYDFKVKVPVRANLRLSTVNKGDVKVKNVSGEVFARNVNGGIFVENISGATDVHTINGDVEIRYSKNPDKHSKYYSLNGDVNVYYFPNLSADMYFKSFQGDMFTNFEIAERLPPVKLSTKTKNGKGTTYKIENKSAVRIGKGGVLLDFETFNGDVYVRKI